MKYAEIVRGSNFGEALYDIAKRPDILSIVEIGLWSGMGTTKCIIDGLMESQKTECAMVSYECIKERWEEAVNNLSLYLKIFPNIKLINGTVISHDKFPEFDPTCMVKEWYDTDKKYSELCGYKDEYIPDSIDLLLIDGGEYTGWLEFEKLWERSKIIALDDIRVYKTNRIHNFLNNRDDFKLIHFNPNERNGFSIFERVFGSV